MRRFYEGITVNANPCGQLYTCSHHKQELIVLEGIHITCCSAGKSFSPRLFYIVKWHSSSHFGNTLKITQQISLQYLRNLLDCSHKVYLLWWSSWTKLTVDILPIVTFWKCRWKLSSFANRQTVTSTVIAKVLSKEALHVLKVHVVDDARLLPHLVLD